MTTSEQTQQASSERSKPFPQITHAFSSGLKEYGCTVYAGNLTFEEALEITKMLGRFIVERRRLIREVPQEPSHDDN